MAIWSKLLDPVTNIINSALDKIAGDKIDEQTKLEIKLAAAEQLRNHEQALQDSFQEFVLEYEGSAKDLPKSLQILRGSVRPVLTYVVTFFYFYALVFVELPPQAQTHIFILAGLVNTFWFGTRFFQRTGAFEMFKTKKE